MVSTISYKDIKKELQMILRNADIISVSTRGVTTTTDEFDGDAAEVNFVLTNSGVKNIRSVTVGGVSQAYGSAWTYSESAGITTVTFASAPASGTDNVDVQYDYSSDGDRIYSDFPKDTVTESKFPRIGFDIISATTEDRAVQGNLTKSNIVISFVAYGVGIEETEDLVDSIRSTLNGTKTDYYYLNYLRLTGTGPLVVASNGSGNNKDGKILQRNLDYRAPLEFETS